MLRHTLQRPLEAGLAWIQDASIACAVYTTIDDDNRYTSHL